MVLRRTLGSLLLTGLMLLLAATAFGQADLPPGEEPPKTLADRVEDAGTADDYEGFNTVIVYDHAINRMKESGVTYVEKTMLYKVLTPAGALEKQVLRWDYDPQSSWVDVQKVVIHRDGKTIDVAVEDVWDLPAPQRAIYWGNRIKLLQLPKLQVNDGIEVHTLRKGYNYALLEQGEGGGKGGAASPPDEKFIPPMPGEYFDIVLFRADVPLIEKKYVLHIVKDKRLISQTYNGPVYTRTDYNADSTMYSWWAFDQPAIAHEPRQPDASDFTPKVVMVTAESWEAKSEWFWDVNQNQFDSTPAIKEKVDAILSELPKNATEEEKAKALVHWVAQNIRYSGQTMGEGEGFTLHPGDMIFENRSGVCKDIAGMLITMMRAAGMDAYPAMTMAGSRIEYEVHADQFNHCVTALKTEDGEWVMYDPTWVPYNNDIWSKLETEQEYLIGHPEGADLAQIPYSPPEESPLKIRHNAELSEDGTLTGTFRLDGKGALDSRMRRLVYQQRRRELQTSFEGLMAQISPRVEDVELKHRDVLDFTGDMWMEISYTIPQYADPVAGGLEFKSPMAQLTKDHSYLFRAGSVEWAKERETDVFLYYTQLIDGVEEIKLPKGWSAPSTPDVDEIDKTYAYFKASSELDKRTLLIKQRVEVRRRQLSPEGEGYQGYREAINAAKEWPATTYRVEGGAS